MVSKLSPQDSVNILDARRKLLELEKQISSNHRHLSAKKSPFEIPHFETLNAEWQKISSIIPETQNRTKADIEILLPLKERLLTILNSLDGLKLRMEIAFSKVAPPAPPAVHFTPIAPAKPAPKQAPRLDQVMYENLLQTGPLAVLEDAQVYFVPLQGRYRDAKPIPEDEYGTVSRQRTVEKEVVSYSHPSPISFIIDDSQASEEVRRCTQEWRDKPVTQNSKVEKVSVPHQEAAPAPNTFLTRLEKTPHGDIVLTNGTIITQIPDGHMGIPFIRGDFRECLQLIWRLGAKIHPATEIDEPKAQNTPFSIKGSEDIYTVCEDGLTLSQMAIKELRGQGFTAVRLPHGAIRGVDPLIIPPASVQENALSIKDYQWDRYPRCDLPHRGTANSTHRFGEREHTVFMLTDKHKERFTRWMMQREKMNEEFFDRILKNGGTIITFNSSFHAMLFRLRERAKVLGVKDLKHLTIIPLICKGDQNVRTAMHKLFKRV